MKYAAIFAALFVLVFWVGCCTPAPFVKPPDE
ncbi:uncharacterized protein METZ01_LOCUS409459, partial [marine metagenome]